MCINSVNNLVVVTRAATRVAHDGERQEANVGRFSDPIVIRPTLFPSCGLMDLKYNRGHIET